MESFDVHSTTGREEPTSIEVTSQHQKHPAHNLLESGETFWRAESSDKQAVVYKFDQPIQIQSVTLKARMAGSEANRITRYVLKQKTREGYAQVAQYPA